MLGAVTALPLKCRSVNHSPDGFSCDVLFVPVLVDRVCHLDQPRPVLDQFKQFWCGNVSLSFVGMAGTNCALDRSLSLMPANWVPLVTNPADAGGVLVFTNTPNPDRTISGASAPCLQQTESAASFNGETAQLLLIFKEKTGLTG
jgi:hypothetical protein